jgi:hypothetical protein
MHIIQLVTLPSEKQQKEQTKNHMQERGRCKANKTITNAFPNLNFGSNIFKYAAP